MTIKRFVTVALGMAAVPAIICCAHSSEQEPNLGERHSEDSVYAGSTTEMAEDSCSERACGINAECCDGYVCGFDPGRSRVQRYCLGE